MKQKLFYLSIILPVLLCCQDAGTTPRPRINSIQSKPLPAKVSDIQPPEGCKRVGGERPDFATWLRNIPVRKDNTVYLYNGKPKSYQGAQFVVLDLPVGKKDLQQCADAVMRLRASWLYSEGRYSEIRFSDNNGRMYACPPRPDSIAFERYLETVFAYCGTLSLAQQLRATRWKDLQPGDVLIRGGSPGHAVIVMDVAVNDLGHKYYMLAQSYMPAQSIHILRNPADPEGGPWYDAGQTNELITTPEWSFRKAELKTW
ncbi:MAG: DUF4846 domain-containing protein [Pseudobacter sp.]|uniref:DUF4846 domain-containing protein n=1 Tax=Pseudobacter sp. TaxID=2045420 RepID=UPI003F80ABD4